MSVNISFILLLLISTFIISYQLDDDLWLIPRPQNYTFGNNSLEIKDPSYIIYHVKTQSGQTVPDYIRELITFYHNKIFNPVSNTELYEETINSELKVYIYSTQEILQQQKRILQQGPILFDIEISNMALVTPITVQDEQYNLTFKNLQQWTLITNTYPGFVRAMETYSELISNTYNKTLLKYQFFMNNTPISIYDIPAYPHRGIMIDSSRHFLSLEVIYQTLDTMMYNKLNVLHWHLTDAESFTLLLTTYPDITKGGAYTSTEIYTKEEVQAIIEYAKKRAIRVIPEIDSPGHTTSWGWNQQFSNITLLCGRFNGQLDPTISLTYQAVTGILQNMNEFFEDNFVHFGGDEVQQSCWDQRPSIKQFMIQNNISSYTQLEYYYRQQEKQIWRNITKTKNATYWVNGPTQLDPDDIIQWWGSNDLSSISNLPNNIILSYSANTYLNNGFGNVYGQNLNNFATWLEVYGFNPVSTNISGTIIGGEASLWSEVNNDQTQSQKLWMRASCFSERLWNPNANVSSTTMNLVMRIQQQKHRMFQRGIIVSPITSEYCERHIDICFVGK